MQSFFVSYWICLNCYLISALFSLNHDLFTSIDIHTLRLRLAVELASVQRVPVITPLAHCRGAWDEADARGFAPSAKTDAERVDPRSLLHAAVTELEVGTAGTEVTIVPGACACVSALAISGLPTRRFAFEAFLPAEKGERAAVLQELQREMRTIVLYEAPHRLLKTLKELRDCLGEERRISLVRELTKIHEEVRRSTLGEAVALYEAPGGAELIRGEYVLVIEGRDPEENRREEAARWESMTVADHVAMYEKQGMDRKEAMRNAAKDRGVSRRDIYQALL